MTDEHVRGAVPIAPGCAPSDGTYVMTIEEKPTITPVCGEHLVRRQPEPRVLPQPLFTAGPWRGFMPTGRGRSRRRAYWTMNRTYWFVYEEPSIDGFLTIASLHWRSSQPSVCFSVAQRAVATAGSKPKTYGPLLATLFRSAPGGTEGECIQHRMGAHPDQASLHARVHYRIRSVKCALCPPMGIDLCIREVKDIQ
jgi:hypothetical protein